MIANSIPEPADDDAISMRVSEPISRCVAPESIGAIVIGKLVKNVGCSAWVRRDLRYQKVEVMGFYGSMIAVRFESDGRTQRIHRRKVHLYPPRFLRYEGTVVLDSEAFFCEFNSQRFSDYMKISAGPKWLIGQTVRKKDIVNAKYLGRGEINHGAPDPVPWKMYESHTNVRLEVEKFNLQKMEQFSKFLPAQTKRKTKDRTAAPVSD